MMQTCDGGVRRRGISVWLLGFVTVMVVCAMSVGPAGAQAVSRNGREANASVKSDSYGPRSYETLYLNGAMSDRDAIDVVTDLRNLLQQAKVYFVLPQRAVSIYGTAEEIALAKKVIEEVGRPMKSYRLTYTLTETGGSQGATTRHVVMLVASGERAEVKQGRRIPVVTASNDPGGKTEASEVQYLDVGLQIRANLSGGRGHLQLHSVVKQTQTAEARPSAETQDPVIEQTSLDGTTTLTEGKPVALGSLDIPASGLGGAKRHMTVEVAVEPAG